MMILHLSQRSSLRALTSSCVLVIFLLISQTIVVLASSRWSQQLRQRIPFFRDTKEKYTPLIFFTVPKGLSPICDAMDKVVTQVEKECHVRVERMDVLRHPEHEAVLTMVTNSIRTTSPIINSNSNPTSSMIQAQPPLLYHRESRQVYQVLDVPPPSSTSTSKASSTATLPTPPYIDKERIRAWAKGRYLSPFIGEYKMMTDGTGQLNRKSATPIVVDRDNNNEMDDSNNMELQLLDEMALSPEQLKGKRLMEERTRAKATKVTTTK